jgi:hypothetical protein
MIALADLRRAGPWLLGLFLLAQAAGVLPLISIHLQHTYASEQDVVADLAEAGNVSHPHHHHAHRGQEQHEHGTTDPGDQCCTLHHHLAGMLSVALLAAASHPSSHIVPAPLQRVVSAERALLEKPPKLHTSI